MNAPPEIPRDLPLNQPLKALEAAKVEDRSVNRLLEIREGDRTLERLIRSFARVEPKDWAAQARCESENRYRRLIADMSAIVFELDGVGVTRFVNDSIVHITGYEASDLRGKNWWTVFFPESEQHQVQTLYQLFETGDVVNHEMTFTCRNGSRRPLQLNFANDHYRDGTPRSILGFGVDITEQKRAERRLRENASRFELLAELSRVFGEGGLDYNRALSTAAREIVKVMGDVSIIRLLSGDGESLETVAVAHVNSNEIAQHLRERLGPKRSSNEGFPGAVIQRGRAVAIKQDGPVQPALTPDERRLMEELGVKNWLAAPLRAHNAIVGTIEILNFGENESYAQEDLRFLEELADRAAVAIVNSRLFHAAQEELKQRKQVERLEQELRHSQKMDAVGKLAGGIAHDFNNLLTIISGNAALLLEQLEAGPAGRAKLQSIIAAADRSAALTRQLLSFSKPKSYQPRVLALSGIVNNIRSIVESFAGENIEVATFVAHDAGSIKAEPSEIDQVILNLVVNARDAMPSGGQLSIDARKIHIDAAFASQHTNLEPGEYVVLTVADTGSGMDKATMSRIFEPFFTTKEVGKGTGLGLFTVYGIVQQLGGHVTVESEVGQGTTFCVYLRQACPVRENAVTATGGMKRSSRGETILVVEDEQELRELVCGYLEAGGYQIFQAEDGERALELAKTHNGQIRLIVTDLAMPKMNGLKLAQEIQASVPDVPVLYMSGCPRRVLEQGIPPEWEGRFLSKPFGPDDLLAKVRSILNVDGF